MPYVSSHLYITETSTNKIQYNISLNNPMDYIIGSDNSLIIQIPQAKTLPTGSYYIETDNRLFRSQDLCLKGKTVSTKHEWNFFVAPPAKKSLKQGKSYWLILDKSNRSR